MNKAKKIFILIMSILVSSCVVRSPVLLETKTEVINEKAIPLKVGVTTDINSSQPTSIWTATLPIPFVIVKAGFPKIVENDYIMDAFTDFLKTNNIFSYCYRAPFDKKDVDLILEFKITEYLCSNNRLYSHGIQVASFLSDFVVPLFGPLLITFGLPQEKFLLKQNLTVDIIKLSGEVVKSYQFLRVSDAEWVWLVEQPFGDYLWYKSIYIKNMNELMRELSNRINEDSALLMSMAKK